MWVGSDKICGRQEILHDTVMSDACQNELVFSTSRQACYFSVAPSPVSDNNVETPSCSPSFGQFDTVTPEPFHPLLASRPTSRPAVSPCKMEPSNLLQLQTKAAYTSPLTRPQPQPLQNVLHVSDDIESATSDNSLNSSDGSLMSLSNSAATARCSRCQRTGSMDVRTGKDSNMIQYGLNLFYCTRCATIVGFGKR